VIGLVTYAEVGMGRLVGDGYLYFYVQDVIVEPKYQGLGIGKEIMTYISRYIETNGLPGTSVTVGLMSAMGKEGFYEKLGFTARPNEGYGAGMMKYVKIKAN
jgi:GNAT superfamily N-acetyltransferase